VFILTVHFTFDMKASLGTCRSLQAHTLFFECIP